MRKKSLYLSPLLLLFACVATPPTVPPEQLKALHPVGFPRVVTIVPECAKPTLDTYPACLISAQMLETSTTALSTRRFIFYWAKTAFGPDARKAVTAATQRVTVTVLEYLYKNSKDSYSQAMREQVEAININSKRSFITFRDAHVNHRDASSNK